MTPRKTRHAEACAALYLGGWGVGLDMLRRGRQDVAALYLWLAALAALAHDGAARPLVCGPWAGGEA